MYNLNNDRNRHRSAHVDAQDHKTWVQDIAVTWIGDANFDGKFDSTDLIQAFASGSYEDGVPQNSGWVTGDWNADLEFTSDDLIAALANGGYEADRSRHFCPTPSRC